MHESNVGGVGANAIELTWLTRLARSIRLMALSFGDHLPVCVACPPPRALLPLPLPLRLTRLLCSVCANAAAVRVAIAVAARTCRVWASYLAGGRKREGERERRKCQCACKLYECCARQFNSHTCRLDVRPVAERASLRATKNGARAFLGKRKRRRKRAAAAYLSV